MKLARQSFKSILLLLISLVGCGSAVKVAAADTIVVMPFENRSQMAKYNWIRESFALLLGEVLDVPGISVISAQERALAFDKVKLSSSDLLTRAAMIRVADAAQANLALIGEYDIGEEKDSTTIAITARLIETREGRLVGNKVFNFSGPLSDLQQWQGEMAWNILYQRNPSLPYSRDVLVRRAMSVPPRAYETYVKAVQTQDVKLRESYLRHALKEYETAGAAGHYGQAIYELGLVQYRQDNFAEAVKNFKEINKDDPNFPDGLFYLGLTSYKLGNYDDAVAAFEKLAETFPTLEVVNNTGAAFLAKDDRAKALPLLRRAVANSPNDPLYRFNYGYALWRNQNLDEAIENLRMAIKLNLRDGEAHLILSKALAAAGRQAESVQADNDAKRYLESYAKWAVAPEKMPPLVRLKTEFNRAAFTRAEKSQPAPANQTASQAVGQAPGQTAGQAANQPIEQTIGKAADQTGNTPAVSAEQQQTLDRARELISSGNDVEAMNQLQRVIDADANNAEAHYLRGAIYERTGQTDNAITALQQAVSRNPRMAGAHVILGRIYLNRGDRALALAHCKQALELEPENRDAVALKQQIETGR